MTFERLVYAVAQRRSLGQTVEELHGELVESGPRISEEELFLAWVWAGMVMGEVV